ncbi:MAG: hypothetical protein IK006_04725 [Bacteroidaceae bacterium]|nr:hypothetical protein [Bacteroidaceae bacterium]
MMKKAVVMFKDSYLLDFINVEEIGLRDSIDVDERVVEKEIVNMRSVSWSLARALTR